MSAPETGLRVGVFGGTPLAHDFLNALTGRTPGVEIISVGDDTEDVGPDALVAVALDAVIVAVAPAQRAAAVAAAVERGLHVCCPLPVAADLPTLDGLMVRAAQAGVIAFAPNLLRYSAPVAQLYERRRTVGKPAALFAAHRVRQGTGGDVFAALALPLIDLAMWVIGGEVERVQVMAERLFAAESVPDGADGADTALMLLRFASGLTATLEVAGSLPEAAAQADELLVEYLGMDAVLRAMPTDLAVTVTSTRGVQAEDFLPPAAEAVGEAFVAAIRAGQGVPQSLVDARWSLAVLEKVRLAAVTGEMVRVGGAVRR